VWVDVVSVVDRAKFIPARVWVYDEGNEPQLLDRDTDPRRWWQVVSSDTAIMTQFDNGATVWPDATGEHPTSSASQPSLMLNMLTALDVHQATRFWRSAPAPATMPRCWPPAWVRTR
jgi:hypothetical protein